MFGFLVKAGTMQLGLVGRMLAGQDRIVLSSSFLLLI